MEIIISFALFSIVLTAVFPAITQARRNLDIAQKYYIAHHNANNMMLKVRDAINSGDNWHEIALNTAYISNVDDFSVWVVGHFSGQLHSNKEVNVNINLLSPLSCYTTTITVVVWNELGAIAGRAVGIAL